MNFSQAEAVVRAYFHDGWNGLTPIAWPDVAFTVPDTTWVRFSMKPNLGYQASAGDPGNNRFRRKGLIFIQVFQKQGQGSIDARAKADAAADLFIGKSTSGITFYDVVAKDVGPDGNGWYQWQVIASYRYDALA